MSVQLKASFWFLVCSFIQRGLGVITAPIYTRLMTTYEYGQYNVFNSWSSLLSIFITLNLTMGVYSQGLVKFSDERNIFSSSMQGLSLTLSLVWTVIYVVFRKNINTVLNITTFQAVLMIFNMWLSTVFSFWSTEEKVQYKYKKTVAITLLVSILMPIISIAFMLNSNDKVTARIFATFIVQLLYIALFFIQFKRGRVFYSKKYWIYSLKFNLPLIPHYLSSAILNVVDKIMIEKICGASDAGIYSLAVSLSYLMTIFNTSLMQTMSPWIYQKIKEKKSKDIASVAYISLIFIAVCNLILIAFAPEAVRIFAPKEYYSAIYVIPPVAMSAYFMFAYDLFAKFEFYYEKTTWISFATMVCAITNVLLNYILIKKIGFVVAGYTTLLCYVMFSVFHYIMMKKISKSYMNNERIYNGKILLLITVSFLIIGFIMLIVYENLFIRYILITILLLFVFIYRGKLIKFLKKFLNLNKYIN